MSKQSDPSVDRDIAKKNCIEPPPWPNDALEFVILVVCALGVGGALFALIVLGHEAGLI
jgi:hypothetical protein